MNIIDEVAGLYRIVELVPFRKTKGVSFDLFPLDSVPHIDSIDRVLHHHEAFSPGVIGNVQRPWYMHPYQADNLMVLYGMRTVDIYTKKHGKVETFTVYPNKIYKNGSLLYEGSAMLVWSCGVFHRIISGKNGSASINIATHYDGFDIRTNFNIYDLDTQTGKATLIREGYKDQFEHVSSKA